MQGQTVAESSRTPVARLYPGGNPDKEMTEPKKALAEYIAVLDEADAGTSHGEARQQYQLHLAAAARMFAAMEKHHSPERLKDLIADERQAYALGLLRDEPGKTAEKAFNVLVAEVEKVFPALAEAEPEEKNAGKVQKGKKSRFEVRFELFPPPDGGIARYEVFTYMGAAKAIVIATLSHIERKGDPIYRVLAVKALEGSEPQKRDLLDRLEW